MTYTLPQLPYSVAALEPYYDRATLEIHHDRHHAAYVDKLNKATADIPSLVNKTVEELLADLESVPEGARRAVLNNGGGHANHSLFWRVLGPDGGGEPAGAVGRSINKEFGSFGNFRRQFSDSALDLFGSGWTFLSRDGDGRLRIENLPNQESPILQRRRPVLLLDLWEHAYYLKWQWRKPEWIDTFWNLVDWEEVDAVYSEEPTWLLEHSRR